jgi:hypothetical protein
MSKQWLNVQSDSYEFSLPAIFERQLESWIQYVSGAINDSLLVSSRCCFIRRRIRVNLLDVLYQVLAVILLRYKIKNGRGFD